MTLKRATDHIASIIQRTSPPKVRNWPKFKYDASENNGGSPRRFWFEIENTKVDGVITAATRKYVAEVDLVFSYPPNKGANLNEIRIAIADDMNAVQETLRSDTLLDRANSDIEEVTIGTRFDLVASIVADEQQTQARLRINLGYR